MQGLLEKNNMLSSQTNFYRSVMCSGGQKNGANGTGIPISGFTQQEEGRSSLFTT